MKKSIFSKNEKELSIEEKKLKKSIEKFNFDVKDFQSKKKYIKNEYYDFSEYLSNQYFLDEYERIKKILRYYFDKLIEENESFFENDYKCQIKFNNENLSFEDYKNNLFDMIIDINFSFEEIF